MLNIFEWHALSQQVCDKVYEIPRGGQQANVIIHGTIFCNKATRNFIEFLPLSF